MRLDERHQIRDGMRAPCAQDDDYRSSSIAVVVADADYQHFPGRICVARVIRMLFESRQFHGLEYFNERNSLLCSFAYVNQVKW